MALGHHDKGGGPTKGENSEGQTGQPPHFLRPLFLHMTQGGSKSNCTIEGSDIRSGPSIRNNTPAL